MHYVACVLFGARVPHPPQEDWIPVHQLTLVLYLHYVFIILLRDCVVIGL